MYATKPGYWSTTKTVVLEPTPPNPGINYVDVLMIEDDVLAVEVIVRDVSGTIVDYVEAGVTYNFEVKYYVKVEEQVAQPGVVHALPAIEEKPVQRASVFVPSLGVSVPISGGGGWVTAPVSAPIQAVEVKTPEATYIPAPSPQRDVIVTMEVGGMVQQMKQMFEVKAKELMRECGIEIGKTL